MSRIRTIKPEFWSSEQIMECSRDARLLFIGLWNFADDAGRMAYSAKRLKAQIFPSDDISSDCVHGLITELVRLNLVRLYTIEGSQFLAVTGWHHQRINRPQPSKIPPPPGDNSVSPPGAISAGMEGKGGEGKGESKTAAQQPEPRARGRDHYDKLDAALRIAAGVEKDPSPGLFDIAPINGLLDAGYDLDADILPVIRKKAATGFRPRSWGYFVPMIHEARGVRQQAASVPAAKAAATSSDLQHPDEPMMRRWWDAWKKLKFWHLDWGPPPNAPGCRIPEQLREQWSHEAAA